MDEMLNAAQRVIGARGQAIRVAGRPVAARASLVLGLFVLMIATFGAPSAAQSIDQIADELDASGRYLEFPATDDIDEAIELVNAEGAAFAWLDSDRDAEQIAIDLANALDDRDSRYKSVLVLTNVGVWAESFTTDVGPAANASFEAFSRGAVAQGLEIFADTLAGRTTGSTATGSQGADGAGSGATDDSSGVPGWVWLIMLALVAFIGFRLISGKRRRRKAEADLLELDRTEVREQVRDNADRVIDLGDEVIASGNAELIRAYEEASRTFTDVSSEVDGITTIDAMNRLDDRMDHAEWQFEVIEATLEGRTPPIAPVPEAENARPGPSTPANRPSDQRGPSPDRGDDEPALGPDESVFAERPPSRSPYQAPRRPSGGFGGVGGGLGSILGGLALGRASRRPRTSRRSQHRRASTGSWTGRRGGSGGGTFRRGKGGGGSF